MYIFILHYKLQQGSLPNASYNCIQIYYLYLLIFMRFVTPSKPGVRINYVTDPASWRQPYDQIW